MNIDFCVNSGSSDYVIASYCVAVKCKDDGAHFPFRTYSGFILLKGDDADKTNDEIYHDICEHVKLHYKDNNGITFEEQLVDPAFESIYITVKKEIHYNKQIKITK